MLAKSAGRVLGCSLETEESAGQASGIFLPQAERSAAFV